MCYNHVVNTTVHEGEVLWFKGRAMVQEDMVQGEGLWFKRRGHGKGKG